MEKISITSIFNGSPRLVNELVGATKFSLQPGAKLKIEGEDAQGFLVVVVLAGEGIVEDMWGCQPVECGESFSPEVLSRKITFSVEGNNPFEFIVLGVRFSEKEVANE